MAGIAAADVICCRRLGRYATGEDHQQALNLLDQAGPLGTRARKHLATLLPAKNKAQYEQIDPTVAETKRVIHAMPAIIALAAQA